MRTIGRRFAPASIVTGLTAALIIGGGGAALGNHHLPGEQPAAPARKAKVIVIRPDDHVMRVGGQRVLNAEICNEDGTGCKPAGRKARWTMATDGVVTLKPKRGAQARAEGAGEGRVKITVKQGKARGTTTVTVNAARQPQGDPEPAAARVLRLVPEHPLVVEGVPYAMTALSCPPGATLETATASGRSFIQSEIPSILDEIEAWKGVGCTDSALLEVEPDAGFREIFRRGNQVLLVKDEGAEGFSVRILAEDGGDFPSDKLSYFGPDAVDGEPPVAVAIGLGELDADELDRLDVNGDGVVNVADIDRFEMMVDDLDADAEGTLSLDADVEEEYERQTDVDGDGEPATADDADLIRTRIGELILDRWLTETPSDC